jgi:tetratricopeptide (TPR) repeat protein
LDAPRADPKTSQAFASGQRAAAEPSGIPRLLVLPPLDQASLVDPQVRELTRSLVGDVTLTLCRSRLYEIIAPFTARQLANGFAGYDMVPSDYVVLTEVVPSRQQLQYPSLRIDVRATASGKQLYQSEVELHAETLLGVHSSFCRMLVARICGQIGDEEILKFKRTGSASAYVHYLMAMKRSDRSDLASLLRAQKSLERSLRLSPDFVPALSQLARTKTLEWLERGSADRALLHEARHLAQRAIEYEPRDSASLREIGHATLYLRDLDRALSNYEAAQDLAPNHADLLADQADVLTHLSRHDEAEAKISRAFSLNPLAPDDYYWIGGAVSFFRGDYQQALDRLTTMRSPGLATRLMAASAAMLGDHDAARSYREMALERDPSFTVDKWTSLYPEPSKADTAHYLNALRLAGFPTAP